MVDDNDFEKEKASSFSLSFSCVLWVCLFCARAREVLGVLVAALALKGSASVGAEAGVDG